MDLTPEQIKYYDDYDEMFATDGWKNFIEEAKTEIYQLQADALDLRPTPEYSLDYLLGRLQGRAEHLAYLTRLEEVNDMQKKLLQEDLDEDE